MSCITIDSGTSGLAGSHNDGTGRQGALASLFRGALRPRLRMPHRKPLSR